MSLNPGEVQRFYLPSLPGHATAADSQGKLPRILLIEDNPADADLVREALTEHGVACELLLATDGERAIRFIQRLDAGEAPCPDLAILDLNLPRKSGRDVLRCMRMSSTCKQLPVIVLTSSDSRRDKDEAAALGASLYLQKPSLLEEFIKLGSVFKQVLGNRN